MASAKPVLSQQRRECWGGWRCCLQLQLRFPDSQSSSWRAALRRIDTRPGHRRRGIEPSDNAEMTLDQWSGAPASWPVGNLDLESPSCLDCAQEKPRNHNSEVRASVAVIWHQDRYWCCAGRGGGILCSVAGRGGGGAALGRPDLSDPGGSPPRTKLPALFGHRPFMVRKDNSIGNMMTTLGDGNVKHLQHNA